MSETQTPQTQENEQTQATQKTTKQKKPVKHGLKWYTDRLQKLSTAEMTDFRNLVDARFKDAEQIIAAKELLDNEEKRREAEERKKRNLETGAAFFEVFGIDKTVDDLNAEMNSLKAENIELTEAMKKAQNANIADHLLKVSLETLGQASFKNDAPGGPARAYLLKNLDAENRRALIEYIRANDITFPES